MHAYSITSRSRKTIIFAIAFASIIACPMVNSFITYVPLSGTVATSSLFAGLFTLVDRFAWKWRMIHWLFATPDLSGEWQITGETSGADKIERTWNASATITQTWTRIAVVLVAERSTSESKIAGMQLLPGHGGRLVYTYENVRTADEDSLADHRGTCELHFDRCCKRATAYYFTDRSRQTVGSMTWTRNPKSEKAANA